MTISAKVVQEGDSHVYHYVAFSDSEEIARVRIPSHLVYIEDEERRSFLFRQVAQGLAEKVHSLGYRIKGRETD